MPPAPQPSEGTDESTLHLDQLMTLREWDATGVARLRPDERAALETWVQKYRTLMLDSAARASESDAAAAPGAVSNGDVASTQAQAVPAPQAPPATGYASAFAVPSTPQYTAPGAATPAYGPAYGSQGPPASGGGAYAGYATAGPGAPAAPATMYSQPASPNAPPAPQSYPPQSYQPNYQPAPAPTPQGYAPQGYAPQGYAPQPQNYPPQSYAPQSAAPQNYPAYAQPSNPAPAPSVVYPTAPSTPPPQGQMLAPAPATSYAATTPPAATPGPVGAVVKTGLAVRQLQGDNRFISLTDGSMWDVYPADRAEAGVWRGQDPVYVRLATTNVSGGYDREIVNASRNVLIRVKFAGQVTP